MFKIIFAAATFVTLFSTAAFATPPSSVDGGSQSSSIVDQTNVQSVTQGLNADLRNQVGVGIAASPQAKSAAKSAALGMATGGAAFAAPTALGGAGGNAAVSGVLGGAGGAGGTGGNAVSSPTVTSGSQANNGGNTQNEKTSMDAWGVAYQAPALPNVIVNTPQPQVGVVTTDVDQYNVLFGVFQSSNTAQKYMPSAEEVDRLASLWEQAISPRSSEIRNQAVLDVFCAFYRDVPKSRNIECGK